VDLLAAFVTLLRLKRHGRDRARIQTPQRDRITRHFAIAVLALINPAQSRVDLGHQLALTVAGAQFQRAIGFLARAVCNVRNVTSVVLQTFDRVAVLDTGRIVLQGTPATVFAEAAWPTLRTAGLEPPAAAIIGARLGLGSTPTEDLLVEAVRTRLADDADPSPLDFAR